MDEQKQQGQRSVAAWGAIFRFNGMINARLDAALRSWAGMSLAEHELLAVLAQHGGQVRMGELARELMFSKSGATRLVAKLEHNGWVTRVLSPSDRRATWAELTPLGEKVLTASKPLFDEIVAAVFADHLSDTGLDRLAADLEHVIRMNGWTATPNSCAERFAPAEDANR